MSSSSSLLSSSSNKSNMLDLSLHKTRRWKRSVTSTDISPSEETCFSSSTSLSSSSLKTSEFCSICNKKNHVARYKCPRCQIPYCSKECYVLHNTSGEKKNCSELFFKDRVMKMSQYEVKSPENVEGMHQILNRTAAVNNNNYEQLDDVVEEECNHNKSRILSDEDEKIEKELMELAQLLNLTTNLNNEDDGTTTNNNNNTITCDETEESILFQAIQSNKFPNIQKMFETSVSNGNLSHLIKLWDPWWIPSPSIVEDNSDQNTKKDKRKKKKRNKTLDEQLLSIPHLSSSSTSAIKPNPNLRYNMIDIVYSIVSCLRYYNGLSDSSSNNNKNETPYFLYQNIEVSEYLLSISQVLSPEKNFTCYESMTEILTSIHQGEGGRRSRTHDNIIPWYVLFQDLIYILENARYLGKVLIIGQDILRKGIRDIKRYDDDEEKKDLGGKEVKKQQQQQLSLGALRKAKKKIEFYLSWYKTHWKSQTDTNNNNLKMCEEIQEYLDHWKR